MITIEVIVYLSSKQIPDNSVDWKTETYTVSIKYERYETEKGPWVRVRIQLGYYG